MRPYNKFLLTVAASGLLGCVKDIAPPEQGIEQPIDMAQYEYLNAYSPLKEYLVAGTTFRLGAGMAYADLDQQGNNAQRGLILSLATSNFNEWVAGNEMKYGSVVANNGTMNFTTVRNFVNLAREQGVDMYGHTLVWHAQQNTRWLNSRIAPTVIPAPPSPGQPGDGGYAMKLSNAEAGNYWERQAAYDLAAPLPEGVTYTIKFNARATGSYGLAVGLQNPETYAGDDGGAKSIGTEWSEVSYTITTSDATKQRVLINLGDFVGDIFIDNISLTEEGLAENMIANGDFETGLTTGWNGWDPNPVGISADGEGFALVEAGGGFAMKVVATGGQANVYDTQVAYNLAQADWLTQGTEYTIKFMVKGESALAVPIVMQETTSGSWQQTGSTINVGTEWAEFVWTFTPSFAGGNQLCLNVGQVEGTFYIDNFSFAESGSTDSIIPNGDFETGLISGWAAGGGTPQGVTVSISEDGQGYGTGGGGGGGYEGGYAMKLANNAEATNPWDVQVAYDFAEALAVGTNYTMTFWAKSDVAVSLPFVIQTASYGGQLNASASIGTEWAEYTLAFTPTVEGDIQFRINMGKVVAEILIDNMTFTEEGLTNNLFTNGDFESGITPWSGWGRADNVAPATQSADGEGWVISTGGDTIIEMTPEEKKTVITAELERWIQGMMEATGADAEAGTSSYIKAWDLVNEAMKDDGSLRSGADNPENTSDFYWQDYMGKDFVRVAAAFARKYGGADLKLFINDFNLEAAYNGGSKTTGLINMIKYWEEDGVTKIDGIGTQMHVSYNMNSTRQQAEEESIVRMYQALAESGKLVKVSELDMGINDEAGNKIDLAKVTFEQHKAMGEFYKFIVSKYFEIIPAAQRYGITQWVVTDNASTDENSWRPNSPTGLWTTGYIRKPAYGGFAEGLKEGTSK